MNVTILASGSKANSMLVSSGDIHILLDCGLGYRETFTKMIEAGINPEQLAAVFLTHSHGDHCSGLGSILKRLDIPVFCSYGTASALKWPATIAPTINMFHPGAQFEAVGLKVNTWPVPHDAPEPCGYSFTHGGIRLAMSTDLGIITPEVERGLIGADVIALESNHDENVVLMGADHAAIKRRILGPTGHLSNKAASEWLGSHMEGTSRVVLIHLSSRNNSEQLARLTAEYELQGRCELRIAKPDGGMD